MRKSKYQPGKHVIAIPSEPVRKAGGRELEFKSQKEAAAYFGMGYNNFNRIMVHGNKRLPTHGYYFDYAFDDSL